MTCRKIDSDSPRERPGDNGAWRSWQGGRNRTTSFPRKGTAYLWIKFQYPPEIAAIIGKKKIEKSTGCTDEAEAYRKFADEIIRHRIMMQAHRARQYMKRHGLSGTEQGVLTWTNVPEMQEGERINNPDGTAVLCLSDRQIGLDAKGRPIWSRDNPTMITMAFNDDWLKADPAGRALFRDGKAHTEERKKALYKDIDADVVDKYASTLKGKGDAVLVKGALLRFKEHTGKTIEQASRADVADFIEKELARRTIPDSAVADLERTKKMVKYLCAAVNTSMREARNIPYQINPFMKPD